MGRLAKGWPPLVPSVRGSWLRTTIGSMAFNVLEGIVEENHQVVEEGNMFYEISSVEYGGNSGGLWCSKVRMLAFLGWCH